MDIKEQIKTCQDQIAALEKRMTEDSFNLKVLKAKLKKWQKLEESATELLKP